MGEHRAKGIWGPHASEGTGEREPRAQARGAGVPGPPIAICVIEMEYGSHEEALAVAGSLVPDDDKHISTRVEGSRIVVHSEASSVMSLLRTLEDFLSCAATAEKVVARIHPTERRTGE